VRFGVLGPVAVWDGSGGPVAAGATQVRRVLAALLLARNASVPVDELVTTLWNDDPPASARRNIQTYVWTLRRALDAAGGGRRIVSSPPGYRLTVGPGELDQDRFEELAGAAARAADPAAAAAAYREALAQWRGSALADVTDGSRALRAQADRLDEHRLLVWECALEVELACGRHAQIVAELRGVAAAHPWRENLCRLNMLALYRSGRQADALAAYRDLRTAMVDQLGVEPGPELRELERRVLVADPALVPCPPDAPGPAREVIPPRQLPPTVPGFTGRAALIELATRLARPSGLPRQPGLPHQPGLARQPGGAPPVIAVAGVGGIGKSAFAVHVAHQLAADFADGQLYVDLCGTSAPPLAPGVVLSRFLRALGQPSGHGPEALGEAAAALRTATADRRLLLVLDNVASAEQVRPLLPSGPGCATIVTSRRVLSTLDAHHLHLDVLTEPEALALLGHLAGEHRVRDEPGDARVIATACGGLPLALRIAGARLAARPDWTAATLAMRLADTRHRLDELHQADLAVRASIEVSFDELIAGADPADRAAALLLPSLATPDVVAIDPALAAAIAGAEPARARDSLDRLVDAQLLYARPDNRYRMHDLIRLFSRERIAGTPAAAEALRRTLAYYTVGAQTAKAMLQFSGAPEPDAPLAAAGPARFPDSVAALRWLEAELPDMVAVTTQATAVAAPAILGLVGRLAGALNGFLLMQSRHTAGLQLHEQALLAARQLGDDRARARALGNLATMIYRSGDPGRAVELVSEAVDLCAKVGDRHTQAAALGNLGAFQDRLGHFDEALATMRRAHALRAELGDHNGQMRLLQNMGVLYRRMGRPDAAIVCYRDSLALARTTGNRPTEAANLSNLGRTYLDLGRPDLARDHLLMALPVHVEFGQHEGVVDVHIGLARLAGGARAALRHAATAVRLARTIDNREQLAAAAEQLAIALVSLDHPQWAAGARQLSTVDG
jgi:DNA-binding SARP family transcriptional activator/tetratricopeptide (TPR) repeat protein